jgi:hypothetical protein
MGRSEMEGGQVFFRARAFAATRVRYPCTIVFSIMQ